MLQSDHNAHTTENLYLLFLYKKDSALSLSVTTHKSSICYKQHVIFAEIGSLEEEILYLPSTGDRCKQSFKRSCNNHHFKKIYDYTSWKGRKKQSREFVYQKT
jgi:hypothetical protein